MKKEENNAARECRKSFPGRGSGKGKTGGPASTRAGSADGVEPVPPKGQGGYRRVDLMRPALSRGLREACDAGGGICINQWNIIRIY